MLFFNDLASGVSRWYLCLNLSIDFFRNNYHRTVFGPIWIVVTFCAFISVKIFIFQDLANANFEYYVAHLTLGYAVWSYLSNAINSGSSAFVSSKNWILGIKLPFSIFILQSSVVCLFNFVFTAAAAMIITAIYCPDQLSIMNLWNACLGIAFLAFSLFWVKFSLAIVCVFFRDAIQLTGTIMRVAFFLTPVIWIASNLGAKSKFLLFNPFHHYINLVRAPLIDGGVVWLSWFIVGGLTTAAILSTVFLYTFFSSRIPTHV